MVRGNRKIGSPALRRGAGAASTFACVLAPLLLAACGGGDGGNGGGVNPAPTPAPTPTPTPNAAPVFTSAAAVSVVENNAGAYQATATDANNDAISFTIAGGADAALFQITSAGSLSFRTPPLVAQPRDANGDNVYEVQIGASDGKATTLLNLLVTVTPAGTGFKIVRVGTGFTQPTYVGAVPNDPAHVFVAEKGGRLWSLDTASGTKELLLTIPTADISTGGERGLVGVAPDPGYQTNKLVLVHVTDAAGAVQIRQYKIGDASYNGGRGFILVVSTDHPGADNHNGGWIAFGPDGHLYDGMGDGGTGGNPAQDANSRLGKILRLARNPDATTAATTPFVPAPGNPFATGGGDPYVFAMGLRNPFRASFAPDNRLVIGDVGEGAREEVDFLRTDQPGRNYGWPFMEGTRVNRAGAPAGLIAPVTEYTHGSGDFQGSSITGGMVYRGPVAALQGQYFFADFVNNKIWSVPYASLVEGQVFAAEQYRLRNADFTAPNGAIRSVVCFGEDSARNMYIVDLGGHVYAVLPN